MTWRVPYIDLPAQYEWLKTDLDAAFERVMSSGGFILRDDVRVFEERMAAYLGVKHVIGVGSGYDALFLALKALGIGAGDRVLTESYTHISTHAAIVNCGAEAVLDRGSSPIKAVVPVHMNGRVRDAADYYGRPVVEDACQAIGAAYKGRKAGTFGVLGCFSLHPMKVLGCAGDGGFIATNDGELDERLRLMRNHGGGKRYGYNSRLDTLQAAILNVKMEHLALFIARRREIAAQYERFIAICPKPPAPDDGDHFDVYSSYVIGGNPALLNHMRESGIECFSHVKDDCVSLPIYPEMTDEQVRDVAETVNAFDAY